MGEFKLHRSRDDVNLIVQKRQTERCGRILRGKRDLLIERCVCLCVFKYVCVFVCGSIPAPVGCWFNKEALCVPVNRYFIEIGSHRRQNLVKDDVL